MKKSNLYKWAIISSLLTLVVTACSVNPVSTVTATIVPANTLTPLPSPTPVCPTATVSPFEPDPAYYDGIIVITQYYTFLGHGLHEEAYWLLSASAQRPHSFEKYVEDTRLAFKTVEIVTIQPLNEWQRGLGASYIPPDPPDKKRFYVQIRAWGEGTMSGSAMNGDLQTLFLTLVQEDGKWKIDSFATGLAGPSPEPCAITTAEPEPLLDKAYYDGIIVIAQYYTFLGHGLQEEAYWMLSASAQRPHSFEKYVEDTRLAFKTVEIVTIQPYYVAVEQQGGQTTPDPSDRKRFAVQIRAWGEGTMSGSAMNGDLQTLFLTLVWEDGKWKIDSFATAPLP